MQHQADGWAKKQALDLQRREIERGRYKDLQSQYAGALGAMTGHLADMYRRHGIPASHKELVDPTCPDR